jgi:Fe-S cluster assembly protein SufD
MDTTIQKIDLISDFSDFYRENQDIIISGYPHFVNSLRETGIEEFRKQGIPSKKSERYKYTLIDSFINKTYKRYLAPRNISLKVEEIFKCDVPQFDTHVILLINGFYYAGNQINGILSDKIWIGSLAKAAVEKPEFLERHFGKYAAFDDGLIALNTACFRDGLMVHVPKGVKLDKPLQVINVKLSDEDVMAQQRNLIVIEDNSEVNMVICDHTLSPHNFFTNLVTEIYVGKGSHYNQTRLQQEHNGAAMVSSVFINQEADSSVNSTTFTLHGGMVRNNLKISLNGERASSESSGLFLTDKTQQVDNYVFVNHLKPNCTSNQFFKGILDDISTGSFYGRIMVHRDAQKTFAYQKSNNLLLSNDAKINSRPQLEIYADDVKCGHGATVGQLDQEALFYLQTRGISKEEARLLLMFAFAHEIIQNIKEETLKERIDELVNKRLRGELTRCHDCQIHCC